MRTRMEPSLLSSEMASTGENSVIATAAPTSLSYSSNKHSRKSFVASDLTKASASSSAAQAASSLALLLREDHLLTKHSMHINANAKRNDYSRNSDKAKEKSDTTTIDDASFAYASDLLLEVESDGGRRLTSSSNSVKDHQQRAEDALGEVVRKLALVESLAERVSRTSPEAVAGPLLRLHGHTIAIEEGEIDEQGQDSLTSSYSTSNTNTLVALRERCERLKRQGDVLEGVASRVETSLTRGLDRMDKATKRLSRVLQVSATLKMILRLQFEASKLKGFILDDLRDLTRAAASVAVIEDLLSSPELQENYKIDVVDAIRPEAKKTAAAVRNAAALLLSQKQDESGSSDAVVQLGATLHVYYHLGELPQAVWSAANRALTAAETVSNEFWSPTTLTNLQEMATSEAKLSAANKKLSDAYVQRALKNKLKEFRAEAAMKWANGITDAAMQVWNLQQVLSRKTDPISRQVFMNVVAEAPIPEKFRVDFESDLSQFNRNQGSNGYGHDKFTVNQTKRFSIFAVFWERLCLRMGDRLKHILEYENGKFASDVSAIYPAVRSAALYALASLKDTMQAAELPGSMVLSFVDDAFATSISFAGLLGGSATLDDPFLKWTSLIVCGDETERPHQVLIPGSADRWTFVKNEDIMKGRSGTSLTSSFERGSTTSMSSVFRSLEWYTLQGNQSTQKGLYRLQIAFLDASSQRLRAPLRYMFTENVTIDDAGSAISHLPLLPSKNDIQRFDSIIRQELAIADPREGGGDLSSVSMIAENIVDMISRFCAQAENAVSNVRESNCLTTDGSPTDALAHGLKVAKIMSFMAECLQKVPQKVFLEPYRPASTSQLEEASNVAMLALMPAIEGIDNLVIKSVLRPLTRAMNHRVATQLARMHTEGAYLQHGVSIGVDGSDAEGTSFVQKHLTMLYEDFSTTYLEKLPPRYSVFVGSVVSVYSVFAFISHASMIRPLPEDAKLHLTQDLADFELIVDQFMDRAGGGVESKSLSEIGNGKAYTELRAIRRMLFWSGLEDKSKPGSAVAKSILREDWVRDIRPSTVFHYLFSFAPNLLSSPHHWKRMRVDEYVGNLVSLDGDTEEGESVAWMTTMQCCDSYQQRESAQSVLIGKSGSEGDSRIAAVLMSLGPELMERRR